MWFLTKIWKWPIRPLIGELINNLECSHSVKYYDYYEVYKLRCFSTFKQKGKVEKNPFTEPVGAPRRFVGISAPVFLPCFQQSPSQCSCGLPWLPYGHQSSFWWPSVNHRRSFTLPREPTPSG